MLTRSTAIAALAGALAALLIAGGFLALDRTTLHWYVEESAPDGLTAAAAEAYVISFVRSEESAASWIEEGWQPDCDAKDRSQDGWLVRCGVTNLRTGIKLPQLVTYLVADDGAVLPFPNSDGPAP